MKINRRVTLIALLATVSACSAERVVPSRPAPSPAPVRTAAPAPQPAPPRQTISASDWRDAPLSPGTWSYGSEGSARVAAFTSPQGARLLALTCHRERGAVLLSRAGSSAAPIPMSVLSSYGVRRFSILPRAAAAGSGDNSGAMLELSLPARDPALDEMAFSRGRIAVEVNGLPTLYLPAHAEIGRIVEDCR